MCLRGAEGGARLCRECHRGGQSTAERRSTAITAVLFVLAFPVSAPGLLYLYLTAKRWGRLHFGHWFSAQVVGSLFCWILLNGLLKWSYGPTLALIFTSYAFGIIFFIREQHLGRS
jgi:hypothetical protein